MAENGEVVEDSAVPVALLLSSPRLDQSPSLSISLRKRQRQDFGSPAVSLDGEWAPKRQAIAPDVIFRVVVPSRRIGKVIGQGGHRVQKIREDTKAIIKIADAVSRHEERVIIISSKDCEDRVSDAEKALLQVVGLILKEDDKRAEAIMVVGPAHVAANTIKLLIAGSQAGSLIGMSGQNIEKLRTNSGATITIFAPSQLPLCASAYKSDRVVQVSGEVSAVLKAVEEIGCQLRINPPKDVVSISPAYNYPAFQRHQGCPQQSLGSTADHVAFEMMIPEALVGGLIGRSGCNISKIRNESGAMIKVHGGKGQQKQRYIQFSGNAYQVALAKQKVDEYVSSQLTLLQDT